MAFTFLSRTMERQADRWADDPAKHAYALKLIGESIQAMYDGDIAPLGYAPRRRTSVMIGVAVFVSIVAAIFIGVSQHLMSSAAATDPGGGPPGAFRAAFVLIPVLMIVAVWASVVIGRLDYRAAQQMVVSADEMAPTTPLPADDATAIKTELTSIWGSVVSAAIARQMRYRYYGGGGPGMGPY